MDECVVSIIIPIYNTEISAFRQCIESIRKQSFTSFEAICVDDGSNAGFLEQYKEIVGKDERFILYQKENGGVSSARNEGIRKAKGKYLTFIDSDDAIAKNYLEVLVEMAETSNLDVAIVSLMKVWNDSKLEEPELSKIRPDKYDCNTDDIKSCILTRGKRDYDTSGLAFPGCKLIRRCCVQEILFDEDLSIGEDLVYILEALCRCRRVGLSSRASYFYYIREDSAMRHYREDAFEVSERLLQKMIFCKDTLHIKEEDIAVRGVYQFVLASRQRIFNNGNKDNIFQRAVLCKQKYGCGIWNRLIPQADYRKLNYKNKAILFLLKNKLFLLYAILLSVA